MLSSLTSLTRKPSTGSSCRLLYSRASARNALEVGCAMSLSHSTSVSLYLSLSATFSLSLLASSSSSSSASLCISIFHHFTVYTATTHCSLHVADPVSGLHVTLLYDDGDDEDDVFFTRANSDFFYLAARARYIDTTTGRRAGTQ